ncbi:NUDIX domain-containing protein [Paenibacillus lentus]|uniref:NUDIX domain-containing protein n=1 Tax=Paenibacillus lentus TaxID=1338368 RepID=UPI003668312D
MNDIADYMDNSLFNGELPGGTLEPGENSLESLRREMLEELGAEIANFEVFGNFYCFSSAEELYGASYPSPQFYLSHDTSSFYRWL